MGRPISKNNETKMALTNLTNDASLSDAAVRPRYSVVGRLCFDQPATPRTQTFQAQCAAERLWSPASSGVEASDEPLEKQLPGLFVYPSLRPPSEPMPSIVSATETHECCICFETIDQHAPLSCPQCAMCAHAGCLAKWFGTATVGDRAGIPSSSASCPYCRTMLDWDALALKSRMVSRRRRMPVRQRKQLEGPGALSMILAGGNHRWEESK